MRMMAAMARTAVDLAALARLGSEAAPLWLAVTVTVGGARRKWWLNVVCGRRQRVVMTSAQLYVAD